MTIRSRHLNDQGFAHVFMAFSVMLIAAIVGTYFMVANHTAHADASSSGTRVALTPPMGFNDWYADYCNVNQTDVLNEAHALVNTGLSRAGYNYVAVDDCWMAPQRTASGSLQANPQTFPKGIAWLASQVHALGLKFGIYESAGLRTCQGKPGSYGHYTEDADTFAGWGVDYLKFDNCNMPVNVDPATLYEQMGQALKATGRSIVYSEELPQVADRDPASPLYGQLVADSSQIANMWRVTPDFTYFPGLSEGSAGGPSLIAHFEEDLALYKYAGPGHWNDLDLLLTGNKNFNWNIDEQKSQMSIWAELASPLMISMNPSDLTPQAANILSNPSVIAVDQSGQQAHLVASYGPVDVVVKPYPGGGVAVLLVNTSASTYTARIPISVLGIRTSYSRLTDLWTNQVSETKSAFSQKLAPYGTVLHRVQSLYHFTLKQS